MKSSLNYGLRVLFTVIVSVALLMAQTSVKTNYETTKTTILKGVVAGFTWANPQSFILVEATDTGKTEMWAVEGSSAAALTRRGWSRTTVKLGDPITISVFSRRAGTLAEEHLASFPQRVTDLAKSGHLVYGTEVLLMDGKRMQFGEKE